LHDALPILTVFAFLTPLAWWFLVFLVFALPIPSPGRKNIELRGYQMSIYASYLHMKDIGVDNKVIVENLYKQVKSSNKFFTGSAYYFMWPMGVESQLYDFVNKITMEDMSNYNETYKNVTSAFKVSRL